MRLVPRAPVGRAPAPPATIVTAGRAVGPSFGERRPAATNPLAAAFRQASVPRPWRHPVRVRMDCFPGPRRHAPPRRQHCNLSYPIAINGCVSSEKAGMWISCDVRALRTRGISGFNGGAVGLVRTNETGHLAFQNRRNPVLFPNFLGVGVPQSNGAIEHRPTGLRVRIGTKITLSLELD